jgi:hypothetical protein
MSAAALLAGLCTGAGRTVAQEIPTQIRPGAYVSAGASIAQYQMDYGQHVLGGAAVYVDVNLSAHYGIESEARWLLINQAANVHASTQLAGLRISLMYVHGFTPYVKLLGGAARFTFPYKYATGTYFVLSPGAGVDLNLRHRLTLRLLDVEYQSWPQFTYGTLHPYGASIGMSYRIF